MLRPDRDRVRLRCIIRGRWRPQSHQLRGTCEGTARRRLYQWDPVRQGREGRRSKASQPLVRPPSAPEPYAYGGMWRSAVWTSNCGPESVQCMPVLGQPSLCMSPTWLEPRPCVVRLTCQSHHFLNLFWRAGRLAESCFSRAPFAALQDGNRSKAPTTQTRCWGHARMQWAWLQEQLVGGGGPRLHFLNFSARRVGLRGRLGQIGGRQG